MFRLLYLAHTIHGHVVGQFHATCCPWRHSSWANVCNTFPGKAEIVHRSDFENVWAIYLWNNA